MNTSGAGAVEHTIKPHEQLQLRSKARHLAAALVNAGKSNAARHKLRVAAKQLSNLIDELHLSVAPDDHACAIRTAIDARMWDEAHFAVLAFEQAVQGGSGSAITSLDLDGCRPGLAANDNDEQATLTPVVAPEREQDVTEQEQLDPLAHHQPPILAAVTVRDQDPRLADDLSALTQLGKAVRTTRTRSGKSQQQIACAAGVGRRFVGEVEAGKPTSEIGKFLAVCSAVGLAIVAIDAQEAGSN